MATLHKSAHLAASPAAVWARIAAVGRVHEILPAVIACRLDGDRRHCTFADGAELEEKIVSIESDRMRLAYAITASPFALEFHAASMQVTSEGDGARLDWTTDLLPDAAKETLAPLFDQIFAQLEERLSRP